VKAVDPATAVRHVLVILIAQRAGTPEVRFKIEVHTALLISSAIQIFSGEEFVNRP
jgi:hypothetical protein